MTGSPPHNTLSHVAFGPPHEDIRRRWALVVIGFLVVAVAAVAIRPVCRRDVAGTNESGFGVRHHQRGNEWVHCEPWIRRVLSQ
ncbi:MAG TPA: hypothetical protein VM076_04765 [Gemmatimonadaceae bacterium]|nr:hypothetical protein [Gemmatimonadaceae bacterium]